jgi:hypothetical protein
LICVLLFEILCFIFVVVPLQAAAALAGTVAALPEQVITVPDRCKLDLYHADWSPILQHVDCVGAAGPLSLKFSTREMNVRLCTSHCVYNRYIPYIFVCFDSWE